MMNLCNVTKTIVTATKRQDLFTTESKTLKSINVFYRYLIETIQINQKVFE